MKCGICGRDFSDVREYAKHVAECAAIVERREKAEKMKKINAELEELKRLKMTYEAMRDDFQKKYPDIYAKNFSGKQDDEEVSDREFEKEIIDFLKMLGIDVKRKI